MHLVMFFKSKDMFGDAKVGASEECEGNIANGVGYGLQVDWRLCLFDCIYWDSLITLLANCCGMCYRLVNRVVYAYGNLTSSDGCSSSCIEPGTSAE